jgi:protein SCO1/2
MKTTSQLLLLAIVLMVTGCQNNPEPANEKVYDVKGKVVAVDATKKKVTLDHEDIPGLMKAMTMPFSVENEALLEGLKPGDEVAGKLTVKSGGQVLTELHKR